MLRKRNPDGGGMSYRRHAAAVVMLCAAATPAWSQTAPVRATLSGRLHYQWNSTSVDETEVEGGSRIARTTFEQRRVRMGVDVQVSDWIRGRVEPEFTMGRLAVRQAWVAFQLDSVLVVRAGQAKKPFGAVMIASSATLPVIERGVRIRGLEDALRTSDASLHRSVRGELLTGEAFTLLDAQRYSGYDMGVSLEGRRGAIGWSAGIYNGTGADTRDENDGVSAAARVSWTASRAHPLVIGAAASRQELNWPAATSTDTRSGTAFAIDAELGSFRQGLWLIGEVAGGENLASGESFTAMHFIAAWFRATGASRVEGWEPVMRISRGDPDTSVASDEGVLVTPGVNLYFAGRNRLMLNWDVHVPAGEQFATQHALRAQINLHF
jgi:hypothetical protein